VLLGEGPILTSIRNGLDDALKLAAQSTKSQHAPLVRLLDQLKFDLHTIKYQQLIAVKDGTPPVNPPSDPMVFSNQYAIVPSAKSGEVQVYYIWSPLRHEWLQRAITQSRRPSMVYKMLSVDGSEHAISKSGSGSNKLRFQWCDAEAECMNSAVISDEALYQRLFHECTVGQGVSYGLPLLPRVRA
jgi:hypothetical protein